ncbi:uncharacterized protein ACNLHF_019489 [Anomaloglossus baeobatrachus]
MLHNTDQIPPLKETNIKTLGLNNPSHYMPPKTHHAVETFIALVDRDIKDNIHEHELGFYPTRSNTNTLEKSAITSLRNNKAITIKPADKGGAIVVQNTQDYIDEIKRQLNDTATYQKIPSDPVFKIQQRIQNFLSIHLDKGTIDQTTRTFLTKLHPITPVFYTLPKIHKSLINPPGRPIVASTESVLSPLSIYLEKILTPLTKNTRSFILDTNNFLQKIRDLKQVPSSSFLCTWDVSSLYTSIPHHKGIRATKIALHRTSLSQDSIDFILGLLEVVLNENYFLFKDDFYIQRHGTAMGSNVAPAYANLFMDYFEGRFVYSYPSFDELTYIWARFIDDIFCIWQGDLESLLLFDSHINNVWPELKFTLNYNQGEINFLDTYIKKDTAGNLFSDLYRKPTDRNCMLLYNSCHPRSTKNSLPRSQFARIKRIVSDENTREQRLDEMSNRFLERNYPKTLLETERERKGYPL